MLGSFVSSTHQWTSEARSLSPSFQPAFPLHWTGVGLPLLSEGSLHMQQQTISLTGILLIVYINLVFSYNHLPSSSYTKAKLMLLSQQGRTGGCLHFTVVRRRLLPWLFAPYAATLRGSVMVMFLLVFDKNLPHQFLRRRQQLTFAQLKSQR